MELSTPNSIVQSARSLPPCASASACSIFASLSLSSSSSVASSAFTASSSVALSERERGVVVTCSSLSLLLDIGAIYKLYHSLDVGLALQYDSATIGGS